jgi:TonB-linked SusC/RagA family outer membrane protein
MKITFILFRLPLLLLSLMFYFTVSMTQPVVAQGVNPSAPDKSLIKLQDAFRKLKTHYRIEILYAEEVVGQRMSPKNSIDLTGSIEKNLASLLHPVGLDFEKQNTDSYIIISKTREVQKTAVDLKSIQNTTQALASTALQFPSTLSKPFLPMPRPVERTISGTVKSTDTKEELPGVSVVLKGTTRGTTTDVNGRFKLEIPEAEVILVFSYVGYVTQEIAAAASASSIEVELKVDDKALEEVVVVGFGQQKKTDVIGSVVSVKPADLKVPSSNLTTALAGRVAGVISYQRSGEPGQDNAAFFIRGVTTFGYKLDPLILIDNVEVTTTELARIQPDDIASFSIMKDATATALYGARGANGVILVITKQGVEGPAKISFRMENSISAPTQNVKLADPVTYMKLHNESVLTRDPLGVLPYSQQKIDNTILGTNPIVYPANDWRSALFKPYTMNQRANLNISGGGTVARYFVAGSFNQDNGVLKANGQNNFNNNIKLKSYTLRSNVNVNLSKSTEMIIRLNGNFDDYTGPIEGGEAMYRMAIRSNPVLFPASFPAGEKYSYLQHTMFGNAEEGQYLNPYAQMVRGYRDYSRSLMLAQLELKQNLSAVTPGLAFRALMNTNRTSFFDVSRGYQPFYYAIGGYDRRKDEYSLSLINENQGREYLDYSEGPKQVSSIFYLESALSYNRTFKDKHGLSGMLVYIMRQSLAANAGTLQLSLPSRNVGLSGRATYSFNSRYFAEFNFGYNGSERFYKTNRFGFFPSAGLAWSVSNEKFWEPLKDVVTNFRLRGTYGLVGNDAIGRPEDRFFYLSNVNMEAGGASFGRENGYTRTGVTVTRYANQDITWETARKMNIALELGFFDKLQIQADYFSEDRYNILMSRENIPSTMGLSSPVRSNVGRAAGKGIDMSADFSHSFGNALWFQARGNFTYATSQYKVYEEPQYAETYRSRIGQSIQQEWGYIAERLFVDEQEVANSPKQNFGEYMAGDIKYRDVNRDGQITEADMVPIGFPTMPEIVYGFGFSAGYKNFDASAFFQGLARESFRISVSATSPFTSHYYTDAERASGIKYQNALIQAYADNYWSEENRNLYALWPRLSSVVNTNNAQPSTWFQRDGSFLRLKQVELGYTLPVKTVKKIKMNNMRLYVNATNLITWSKFKLWDVEMASNGLGYPLQRVINMGLHVSF